MEIRHKTVPEMLQIEYRAAYSANYKDGGYMQGMLANARESKDDTAKVILLWDGPNNRVGSLVGWVLLTPVSLYGIAAATRYTKSRSIYTAQFWVKSQHRKKGHAKTLMAEVKKYDPRPHVIPHNPSSGAFFSSYDVTTLKSEAGWIDRKKPKVA